MLARTNGPIEDIDDLAGTYFTPPVEMEITEAHPRLIQEVIARPNATIKLYYASLFEIPSAVPIGHMEIAIDNTAGEACGLHPFTLGDGSSGSPYAQAVSEPVWIKQAGATLDDTLVAIYENLKADGVLL